MECCFVPAHDQHNTSSMRLAKNSWTEILVVSWMLQRSLGRPFTLTRYIMGDLSMNWCSKPKTSFSNRVSIMRDKRTIRSRTLRVYINEMGSYILIDTHIYVYIYTCVFCLYHNIYLDSFYFMKAMKCWRVCLWIQSMEARLHNLQKIIINLHLLLSIIQRYLLTF